MSAWLHPPSASSIQRPARRHEGVETEQAFKMERDSAFSEVAELKATIEGLSQARPDAETHWVKEPTKRCLTSISVGIVE